MRYAVLDFSKINPGHRLDARFYVGEKSLALERLRESAFPVATLGELLGDGNVWSPPRFTFVPALDAQFGKPYLSPWDTLRYMPRSNVFLSRIVDVYTRLEVRAGWLLITASGRNLSPCVLVDRYLEAFAVSSDMIRVSAPLDENLFYGMAFLHTTIGRQQLSGDKWGSVIDHIQPPTVRSVLVPMLPDDVRKKIARNFQKAAALRERARLMLSEAERQFLEVTGLRQTLESLPSTAYRRRFVIDSSRLRGRLDAEPYAPLYEFYRESIQSTGCAARLKDAARIHRPPGRYRPVYVRDRQYGMPLLSGRQISQFRPVGLKYISPLSLRDPDAYKLSAGTLVLAADGRAEENLGDCSVILEDRHGWAASGHVIRLVPRDGIHLGLLYLACTSSIVQAQMKALATGSVVDALSEEDIGEVLIPYPDKAVALGDQVIRAWEYFAAATRLEDQSIAVFEGHLSQVSLSKATTLAATS